MSGRVDHIESERLPFEGPRHAYGLALDGDATFALNIHAVQVLVAHISTCNHPGELKHAVSQGGLAVIDVSDDAEIADALLRGGRGLNQLGLLGSRNRGQTGPPEGL